jgi:hypothetical protein
MSFGYYLPVPPGVICDSGTGFSCPPGCSAIGSKAGGFPPCTPQAPEVGYEAEGSSDCMGTSQTAVGSWQLSLTSVTSNNMGADSAGSNDWTPHGTFTATLVASDGGTDTATISASF